MSENRNYVPRPRRRRRKRRRRGPGVILKTLAMLLIIAAVTAALIVFFKIRDISVNGATRYTAEQIIEASEIRTGANMFLINKFKSISKIFAQFPYLDEIIIRRTLPDQVEITVTECVPAAAYESGGAWYILDAKGKVLEKTTKQRTAGLCVIRGVEADDITVGKTVIFSEQEKQKPVFSILNMSKDNDILSNIHELNVEKLFAIELRYTDRFIVKLGTVEQFSDKIRLLGAIIERLGANEIGVIDVSDPQRGRFRPEAIE